MPVTTRPRLERSSSQALLALCFLALALLAAPGQACMFSQPPPPACGKSLLISTAVPHVVLLPGGGTFDVTALVFFTLVDFPSGSGICPAGPYTVDVDLTVTCSPAGDGGGSLIGTALSLGFNELTVPVTLPAGPPRRCVVAAEATVALADGMTLTAESDSLACIADPAPGDPGEPRLDLELQGGVGAEISRAHPGDQSTFTYRITNNDPSETFTGDLTAESLNTARLPGVTGPMPPGTGVFSISDPVQGDNFPLAFEDQLFEGCVVLPADPSLPGLPTVVEPLLLGPGESVDIAIFSRSWGMCADGSCSENRVLVSGEFSDLSDGLACGGTITAADTGVEPTHGWPDAGEVAEADSPQPNKTKLSGKPRPEDDRDVDLETVLIQLLVDGLPSTATPIPASGQVFPELGRTQIQLLPDQSFQVDSFFDIFIEIDVDPGAGLGGQVRDFDLLPGVPTGFDSQAPAGRAVVELGPSGFQVDSFFDITYQIEVVGIDEVGERRPAAGRHRLPSPARRRPGGAGNRQRAAGPRAGPRLPRLHLDDPPGHARRDLHRRLRIRQRLGLVVLIALSFPSQP